MSVKVLAVRLGIELGIINTASVHAINGVKEKRSVYDIIYLFYCEYKGSNFLLQSHV